MVVKIRGNGCRRLFFALDHRGTRSTHRGSQSKFESVRLGYLIKKTEGPEFTL